MTPAFRVPALSRRQAYVAAGAIVLAVALAGALALTAFGGLTPVPTPGWALTLAGRSAHFPSAPTTRSLERLVPMLPERFDVAWTGYYVALAPGLYTFVLDADDEATLQVAGETVLELRGATGIRRSWTTRHLSPGVHPVRIEYRQLGGAVGLRPFLRPPYEPYTDLGDRVFPSSDEARRWLAVTLARLGGAFLAGALLLALAVGGLAAAIRRLLRPADCPVSLRGVLAVTFLLLAPCLSWGLPYIYTWGADEMLPALVLDGMRTGFSSGWHNIYPPGAFYLLSVPCAPFAWLRHVDALDLGGLYERTALVVLARFATLTLALVSVWLVYVIARELERPAPAAVAAATLAAFTPLYLYYGRTANIDVTCGTFVLAAIAVYVRLLKTPGWTPGYVALGVCSAAAVAIKDPSVAFLPGIALHLVAVRFRDAGSMRALIRHRGLWLALAAFLAAFALLFNLVWNWHGFLAHVRVITGPASSGFRVHPNTVAGLIALAADVLAQVRWSLGWAATLAAFAGVLVARRRGWPNLPLLVPSLSYLLCFTAVVGFSYDRFQLIPVTLACVAAGTAVGAWWTSAAWRRAARMLAVLALGYTAAHGLSVVVLTLHESRYAVERWLLDRVSPTSAVGWIGRLAYLPRLLPFGGYELATRQDLTGDPQLEFVVVNRSFSGRRCAATEPCRSLYDGTAGFERMMTTEEHNRLVMRWEWRYPPGMEDPSTNLAKISPVIDVFGRARHEP
jgi:hypothetical protein